MTKMKKAASSTLFLIALLCMGCDSGTISHHAASEPQDSLSLTMEGDSTLYGLACDGCNDTILIFLPLSDTSRNPDTFNVLNANRQHRVFGYPKVGDRVAIMPNAEDSTVADVVVNMEDIIGAWCYEAKPFLRKRADMSGLSQRQIMNRLSDSLQQLLSVTHEQGIQLNGDNTARPIGTFRPKQDDEEDLIGYPTMKRYRQWRLYNGKLLLTTTVPDSLGQEHATGTDTVGLVFLEHDSIALLFNDTIQGFYRKEKE